MHRTGSIEAIVRPIEQKDHNWQGDWSTETEEIASVNSGSELEQSHTKLTRQPPIQNRMNLDDLAKSKSLASLDFTEKNEVGSQALHIQNRLRRVQESFESLSRDTNMI